MHTTRRLLIFSALIAALCPLWAQPVPDTTLTITIAATLGPVLSGPDLLGANGRNGMLTVMASESLSPIRTTATSATYALPAGAMSVVIGATTYRTPGPSTVRITLGAASETVVLAATIKELGIAATLVGTAVLNKGSFPPSVLTHPTAFQPTPQKLGAASRVKYAVLGSSTVLGLAGSVSDIAAADAAIPDDDDDTDQ